MKSQFCPRNEGTASRKSKSARNGSNQSSRWYLKRWMISRTMVLATTAERADEKCNSISRQFVHSKTVVMSPSNGKPQRSQNGGRMKRTCVQHFGQKKPSLALARP